jgi:hypothetical protein
VAEWRVEGGFVGNNLVPPARPQLAVYSDGTAVADVRTRVSLSSTEVRDLVAALRTDLAGIPSNVEDMIRMRVMDAQTTTLTVLEADGTLRSVRADGLGEVDGFPTRLVAARDVMSQLAERVQRGTPFVSDGIRLYAWVAHDPLPGPARAWPAGVPFPPQRTDLPARVADLRGAEAAAAVREWPDDGFGSSWPVAQASDGQLFSVAWRYLLPDE